MAGGSGIVQLGKGGHNRPVDLFLPFFFSLSFCSIGFRGCTGAPDSHYTQEDGIVKAKRDRMEEKEPQYGYTQCI